MVVATVAVLGTLSVRPADSRANEAAIVGARMGHDLRALRGSIWLIANGQLAKKKATGVLYDPEGFICTGTQVERSECILSAAHCQTKPRWAAHERNEWELGLPVEQPLRSARITRVVALGAGTDTTPAQQAQDLAIFRREQNERLPAEYVKLNLRPPPPFKEGRVWRLFGRGPTEVDANSRAMVSEAWMAESALHDEDPEFGDGNGAYYDLVPWNNGDGAPDVACRGDSGGPSYLGEGIRGVISGGTNGSLGSWFTGMPCGSATSNQITSTSLNGNGDFLTYAIAEQCCVCIPPERSPFCHFELESGNAKYACWNGAKCNVEGARPKDPDGKPMPLCHHEGCFDEATGKVFEIPTGAACGGGGGRPPPPPPPGDPVPPPTPADPVPPKSPGKGGHGS
ncbi:trypsin-like serine protease [Paraliomyxa miuraensis]|uniref:trypsin-like serine protease n=1 Tax=Paraliomyxa miuraensis TaxID=376150 RepID=UPI002251361D|nr:trypsin-like serine protease [Paraliomyxa miuraensis]MCX4244777.1 trypsin-like serine protease [Paraliomyxa miuraensis]